MQDEQKPTVPASEDSGTAPSSTPTSLPTPIVSVHRTSHRGLYVTLAVIVALGLGCGGFWLGIHHNTKKATTAINQTTQKTAIAKTSNVAGLQLNTAKDYGDKYANGILPVGDGKYVTTGPKNGYVYACSDYARNLGSDNGGASKRGPWFNADGTQYDSTKKVHVLGSVLWQADFTNTVSGDTRTIVTNDLPSHPTGTFPIRASDTAYAYDRNPNTIKGQTFTYTLSTDPTYSETPNCEGGQVGIMLTGVALFSAFDAGGRDAGAWEVQDSCSGHPQNDGIYHYHTLSSCIKDTSVHTVIGYALDGFPITGPQVTAGNVLTTADLDECHGIVSGITVGGKTTTMYHYVMTQDFPYSVSCFRGMAIQAPGMQGAQPSRP